VLTGSTVQPDWSYCFDTGWRPGGDVDRRPPQPWAPAPAPATPPVAGDRHDALVRVLVSMVLHTDQEVRV
jgi:hypothetical protein